MLLQRVLTALVLIPLVFAGVLYLPPAAFAAVLGGWCCSAATSGRAWPAWRGIVPAGW